MVLVHARKALLDALEAFQADGTIAGRVELISRAFVQRRPRLLRATIGALKSEKYGVRQRHLSQE